MSILDRSQSRWGLGRVGGRRAEKRRRRRGVVGMEVLEVRVVPSSTWTGHDGATSTNWSDANNWLAGVAPVSGDDLTFEQGPTSLISNNDSSTGTAYGSLTIADTGYSITGNAASFTSIDASQASGSSTVDLPIDLSGAVSVDEAPASLVLGGVISGSAGLTKNGLGTLDLTGANTYTGTTAITTGTLLVDGAQAGSPVTVASGATLGGIGTVGGITATGGTVSPGDSAAGVLVDAGSFSMGQDGSSNNSTYSVVIDGSAPGGGAAATSQTQVAGGINLTGASLNVTLGPDFTPSVPTSFTIIDNTGTLGVAGTFEGQPQGSTIEVDGNTFQINYAGGSTGKSVVLTEVTPTTTSLVAPTTSVFGQSVALTATVAAPSGDPTPTGMVDFFNGTTSLETEPLSGGTATLNTALLPVATNSITAQYQGEGNYGTSTSSPASSVTVSEASTTVAVTASPASPIVGDTLTVTATVTVVSPGTGTPTGKVDFMNGSTLLGVGTLAAGVATYVNSTLPAGNYAITADYLSDGNYATSNSSPLPLTVAAAATSTTTVTASTTSPVYGQAVTFTMTVAPISPATGTPTGTVNLMNGTTLLDTATLSGGTATFETSSPLPLGTNPITAVYSGDNSFTSSTSSPALTVTVGQADSSTLVTFFPTSPVVGQSVVLTATVSAAAPGSQTPTGSVEFFNGTSPLGTPTLVGGVATFSATTLAAGANLIKAQYLGDSNFLGDTSPIVTVTLVQTATTTTTVSFTPSAPVYGQDVTLTAKVAPTTTGTPTGTVQFFNGTASLGSAAITNGVATLAPTALAAGANSITAQYSGDSTFTSSTSPVNTVTVGKATTTTTVTFAPAAPVFGQSVTLTATITPTTTGSASPTGMVTFLSGTTTLGTGMLTNGVAKFDTSTLPVGTNSTITADYQGDTNYATSTSAPISVPVAQASTATAVILFPTSPVVGQNVTFTATVSAVSPGAGTPTGTVQFFTGTTSLGPPATITAGVATLVTTGLLAGDNAVTAQYSGDPSFAGNTSPVVTVTVAATATSTTKVTFSPSAPFLGQSVTLTATVAPVSPLTATPTGSVEFFNGTTLLGVGTLTDGVGTIPVTTLPVGSHSITAQYSGDSNLTSSTSAAVTVPVTEISTTTALTFAPSSPAFGTSVTFTATITPASVGPAAPSGTVDFFNGSTMIGSGTVLNDVATFTTTALPVGTNSITAKYVGDASYAGSTSSPATVVTIAQNTTTTTVAFSPTLPVSGQVVTLTATITPTATGAASPTGTVDFFNGSTLLGAGTLSNDVATLNTTGLTVGNNAVTAQYLGDSNYAGSTSAVNTFAVVLAATTTTVSVSNGNPAAFESVTLTAVVAVNSPGAGTATGTVEFFASGTSLGTATLSAGQATLSVVLPTAVNSITAQYSGSSDLQPSTSTTLKVAVGSPNEQWLDQVYLLELGRAPTQTELTRGLNQLARGVSRKKVVNGIANSPEATVFLVQSNYERYLGVQPTSKQVHRTLAEAQSTHTSVLAVILGSQLFYEQSGGSLLSYLASLETAVLGAPTQEFGLRYQLQKGVSRTKVANELLTSNLGKLSLLSPSFVAVLGRAPTRAELGNFVNLMSQGKNLRNIVASLLASDEFYTNSTT